MKNKDQEIKRLYQDGKVDLGGGVKISGDVKGSTINTGDVKASNIAGGNSNVYYVSRNEDSLIDGMKSAIAKENLSPEEQDYLFDVIKQMQTQLDLGSNADEVRINFLLKSVKMVSMPILEKLGKKILSQDNITPEIRRLVRGIL